VVLSAANVAFYLCEHGYVTAADIVDGELTVDELSQRNHIFAVRRSSQPGYLVKQVKEWRQEHFFTLEREAECYWRSRNDPDFSPLAGSLPACYAYDAEHEILILELLAGGENLNLYHAKAGFPEDIASLLGNTLATLQADMAAVFRVKPPSAWPEEIPWVLTVHESDAEAFNKISPANIELLRIVHGPEFAQSLNKLKARWQPDTLIHGDFKWDHCILHSPGEPGSKARLSLVDWEFADFGDGCWDAGAVLHAYLNSWIRSLPAVAGLPMQDLVDRARFPLSQMQPAIRAFWKAYTEQLDLSAGAAEEMLDRSVCYAAARMIQSAWEGMQKSSAVTAAGIRLLQVSFNILSSPADAVHLLLGM
jgi:hypothetical protein